MMQKDFLEKKYWFFKNCWRILKNCSFSFAKSINSNEGESGKSLFILGNGSSLKDFNFQQVCDFEYLVVNRHVLHESYPVLKPRYYVVADSYFTSNEEGRKILSLINQVTSWEMNFYIPYRKETYRQVSAIFTNPQIKLHFYNTISMDCSWRKFAFMMYDLNLNTPFTSNVLVAALYIGICNAYKRIELYGVEHSWTKNLYVDDTNRVCLIDDHFYDNKPVPAHVFDMNMGDVLKMYSLMFATYHEVREYALYKGVRIINKTKNSFVDAFDRE